MNKLFIIGSLFLIFSGTIQVLGDDYLGIPIIILGIIMFILRNKKNLPVQPLSPDVIKKKRILISFLVIAVGCLILLGYQYFVNGYIDYKTVIITFVSLIVGIGIQVYIVKRHHQQKQ